MRRAGTRLPLSLGLMVDARIAVDIASWDAKGQALDAPMSYGSEGRVAPVPQMRGEFVRCIMESLALRYCWVLDRLDRILGRPTSVVHMVGGGARNEPLCQLTSDARDVRVAARRSASPVIDEPRDQARWTDAVERFGRLVARQKGQPRYPAAPGSRGTSYRGEGTGATGHGRSEVLAPALAARVRRQTAISDALKPAETPLAVFMPAA
ncbi:MAG TPA: FGGY-family carbohydrate kinase [bacterium]|nr:FGGY-family carbohydrate kinase [bacterium]